MATTERDEPHGEAPDLALAGAPAHHTLRAFATVDEEPVLAVDEQIGDVGIVEKGTQVRERRLRPRGRDRSEWRRPRVWGRRQGDEARGGHAGDGTEGGDHRVAAPHASVDDREDSPTGEEHPLERESGTGLDLNRPQESLSSYPEALYSDEILLRHIFWCTVICGCYRAGMSVTDLQFAVLSSLAAGRRHGYGLLRDAEAALGKSLPVATAYAAIEGMVSRGWIIPDGEEVVHSRTRRYYALAPAGFQTLKARADQMEAQARLAHQRLRDATGKAATA